MNIIHFDSTIATTEWAVSTAYILGDIVNAIDDSHPVVYECTVGGTSGGSEPVTEDLSPWLANTAYALNAYVSAVSDDEPVIFRCSTAGTTHATTEPVWDAVVGNFTNDNSAVWVAVARWRDLDGDVLSDGSVSWVAKDPFTWPYAFIDIKKALGAWTALGDKANTIFGEKFHYESGNPYAIFATIKDYDGMPAVYRVDKLTGLYSPSKYDGTTHTNFAALANNQLSMDAVIAMYGFRLHADGTFRIRDEVVVLEDCVLEMATGSVSSTLFFNGNGTATFINCKLINDTNVDGVLRIPSSVQVKFILCEFHFSSKASGLIDYALSAENYSLVEFIDCDLSDVGFPALINSTSFTSGNPTFADENRREVNFINCTLPANYTLWDGVWLADRSTKVSVENCSADGSASYLVENRTHAGSLETDIARYLTAGYQEPKAGTHLAQVLTPEDRCSRADTKDSSRVGGYIDTAGAKIFTIEMLENYTDPLTLADMWLEFAYFNSALNTFHTIDMSTKRHAQFQYPILAEGIGLSAWSGSLSGYRSVRFQIAVTVAKQGTYFGIIRLAKYESGKSLIINPAFTVTE